MPIPPIFTIVFNFNLHTKIVSSHTKDFAVSCGELNENRFSFNAMFMCVCVCVCARADLARLSYIFPPYPMMNTS